MKPRWTPLVPLAGPARVQRPSLHWVLRGEFPSCDGTMALSDSLCPSRRASLPSLGDTLRCACASLPAVQDTQPRAWGFVFRSPLPDSSAGKQAGPPRFPDNPLSLCPVLRPRQDRTRLAKAACRHGPRYVHNEGSHELIQLSRLNRTASGLAVYASSDAVAHTRRKTRFRPLAKRYRTGLVTRRVVTKEIGRASCRERV